MDRRAPRFQVVPNFLVADGLRDQELLLQVLVHGLHILFLKILKSLFHQLFHVDRIGDRSKPPSLLTRSSI